LSYKLHVTSYMKLSVCIPTFNEQKNIHLPLASTIDIADEIVIIDGGSTDKTREIAASYGPKVKIYQVDNPANFLVNKQRAIEKARGEWILQLDADEALSPKLKEEIAKLLNLQFDIRASNFSGYLIPRKNWFLGRYLMKGGVYPDYVLRLYKREGAYFELKNVHENVIIKSKVKSQKSKIGYFKNPILHNADPTFKRYLLRWNRYNTFDARQLLEEKEKPCLPCYFIGKPLVTFLSIYIRHKGFMDGWQGLVWAFFSAIRYWGVYLRHHKLKVKNEKFRV